MLIIILGSEHQSLSKLTVNLLDRAPVRFERLEDGVEQLEL